MTLAPASAKRVGHGQADAAATPRDQRGSSRQFKLHSTSLARAAAGVGHHAPAPSIPLVNHLADETSPYLRQHADNPVEWFPWGDEALRRAREEDKPIFLSIGYASCHWCHVMAHESFEDPETAADLAHWFISVKVDREERPDLDTVYMAATQALTGSGGWPMSVFCTPDGRPFYAGTYFPPVERHGMPPFRRVVQALGEAWLTERDQVLAQADALVGPCEELRLAETLGEAEERRPGPGRTDRPWCAAGPDSTPPRCVARWSTGSPPASTPSGGASAPRRSFPGPRSSSSASGTPARGGPTRTRRATWPVGRSTPWRPGASTTTSSGGSAATRPTRAGWCRTSRRC